VKRVVHELAQPSAEARDAESDADGHCETSLAPTAAAAAAAAAPSEEDDDDTGATPAEVEGQEAEAKTKMETKAEVEGHQSEEDEDTTTAEVEGQEAEEKTKMKTTTEVEGQEAEDDEDKGATPAEVEGQEAEAKTKMETTRPPKPTTLSSSPYVEDGNIGEMVHAAGEMSVRRLRLRLLLLRIFFDVGFRIYRVIFLPLSPLLTTLLIPRNPPPLPLHNSFLFTFFVDLTFGFILPASPLSPAHYLLF